MCTCNIWNTPLVCSLLFQQSKDISAKIDSHTRKQTCGLNASPTVCHKRCSGLPYSGTGGVVLWKQMFLDFKSADLPQDSLCLLYPSPGPLTDHNVFRIVVQRRASDHAFPHAILPKLAPHSNSYFADVIYHAPILGLYNPTSTFL